jgi:hypothetical protein
VGLNSLKSLNLTNVCPNNKKNKINNKVKSKPLELYELAGKNLLSNYISSLLTDLGVYFHVLRFIITFQLTFLISTLR